MWTMKAEVKIAINVCIRKLEATKVNYVFQGELRREKERKKKLHRKELKIKMKIIKKIIEEIQQFRIA